jgi:hypothetical protein
VRTLSGAVFPWAWRAQVDEGARRDDDEGVAVVEEQARERRHRAELPGAAERAGRFGDVVRLAEEGSQRLHRAHVPRLTEHGDGREGAEKIAALRGGEEGLERRRVAEAAERLDRRDRDVVVLVRRPARQRRDDAEALPPPEDLRHVTQDGEVVGAVGQPHERGLDLGGGGDERVDRGGERGLVAALALEHLGERGHGGGADARQRGHHRAPHHPARLGQHRHERLYAGAAVEGQALHLSHARPVARREPMRCARRAHRVSVGSSAPLWPRPPEAGSEMDWSPAASAFASSVIAAARRLCCATSPTMAWARPRI